MCGTVSRLVRVKYTLTACCAIQLQLPALLSQKMKHCSDRSSHSFLLAALSSLALFGVCTVPAASTVQHNV